MEFFSVDELFEKVLERLEDDNKESGYKGNLVEQVLIILVSVDNVVIQSNVNFFLIRKVVVLIFVLINLGPLFISGDMCYLPVQTRNVRS